MEFLDRQAEESDGEESSVASGSDDEPRRKKVKVDKKNKKKTKKIVESSDDDDDDDDDDEGREEMKGFIADEEDEVDEEAKSEKSEKEDEEELDEDDMELLHENLDLPSNQRSNNRARLDDSDEEDDRAAIEKNLFGGDAGDDDQERGERPKARGGYSENEYSDSENSEDNFIEDDGERPSRPRHRNRNAFIPEGAADDARDVFGVEDFNFDEFYDEDEIDDVLEDEEEEIIEDDGEGGEIRVRRQRQTTKKATLMDAIEPSELEKGFLSAYDKKIMIEDTPERFLLRRTPVTECDEEELEAEAKWVYHNSFDRHCISCQNPDRFSYFGHIADAESQKASICFIVREVLRFIRVKANSYEVPFIHYYKKECLKNTLTQSDLWKVYDMDEKWCHLVGHRRKLVALMKRMQKFQDESDDPLVKRRMISITDIIDANLVDTLEQLSDHHANFQLLYGSLLDKMTLWEHQKALGGGEEGEEIKAKFRSSNRNDKYHLCVENGIGEFVARFGLTAAQFAENLDWKKHEVEQEAESPYTIAEEYLSTTFATSAVVIEGAKFMMAKEISRQPIVRSRIRREFREGAVINVKMTKKGRDTIDDSHPMWNKRYIKDKPVSRLENEEFFYYHLMKESGLIEFSVDCDSDFQKASNTTLTDRLIAEQTFHRDEYTENVEEWNALRADCVRLAVDKMLIPFFKDETYQVLLEEAKTCVIKKCAASMHSRLEMAGFVPPRNDYNDSDEEPDKHGEIRIMAIVYATERDEASFGAMIDEEGNVIDYLRMVHFTKRSAGNFAAGGPMQRLKAESMDLFKRFVVRRRPHIVALCAEDMEAVRLKRDLEDAIKQMLDSGSLTKNIEVVIRDNEAAKVYMRSSMALMEHPDYPPTLRQAISLARLVLDPVIEHAHLWNSDEDIFCLAYHPLQRDISQEELCKVLLHEIMNRVNEMGVDVNRCVESPQYTSMLQFVAGLGPRKAMAMIKNIKQNDNLLESRSKLVTTCKLGPKVFVNCCGFIKIDTAKVSEKTDAYVEVLDASRVHPETYEWARKMAVDALEVDDSTDPTTALVEVMESPERLKDLDLDAFAEELNRQGFGEKKATLYDIAGELNCKWKDVRAQFRIPDNTELYELLTRSSKPLLEGHRVFGTVVAVQYKRPQGSDDPIPGMDDSSNMFRCPQCKEFTSFEPAKIHDHLRKQNIRDGGCPGIPVGVKVRLDNGILGFVRNKDISKDMVENPLTRINQAYFFKVLKVEPEKFSCLLSCKSSDLQSVQDDQQDQFWDSATYTKDCNDDKQIEKKKNEEKIRVKRVISHPNFHNISFEEATKLLDSLDWSECVIRPSAHKSNSLSVTWKVANGIYHNFFVRENNKETVFSIGKNLSVGDEEFEDLNELVARFVQPMIHTARDITTHKYFYNEAKAEQIPQVEEYVHQQQELLGRLPYVFTASQSNPCTFCISYMFDNTHRIRHEFFTINPRGLRYRRQSFPSLEIMLYYFKKHFNDRPPEMHRR